MPASIKIRALGSALQVYDETTNTVVATTTAPQPTLSAYIAPLQTQIDDYNAAQGPLAEAGIAANSALNS